jgi:DNA-binding GntR family transcriptional regulator
MAWGCLLHVEIAHPVHLIVAQHALIVDAIKASDPVAAEKAMHQHLSEILRSLPELAARYPDLFEPETDVLPEVLSA